MLAEAATLIGSDGLHPTEAGYRRIADLFFAAIRAELEETITKNRSNEERTKSRTASRDNASRVLRSFFVIRYFNDTRCTRQFVISPISSSFSLRQSIELARPNSFELLAGRSELADHLAVERHLVDGGVVHAVLVAGVRDVEILRRAARHAHRQRRADVAELRLELALAVEDLDALVAGVGDVDVARASRRRSTSRR